jgi:hypothetical protein
MTTSWSSFSLKKIVNTVVPGKCKDPLIWSTSRLETTYIVGSSEAQNVYDSSLVNPKWDSVGLYFIRAGSMSCILQHPPLSESFSTYAAVGENASTSPPNFRSSTDKPLMSQCLWSAQASAQRDDRRIDGLGNNGINIYIMLSSKGSKILKSVLLWLALFMQNYSCTQISAASPWCFLTRKVILTLGVLSSVHNLVTWRGLTSAGLMAFAHLIMPPTCWDWNHLYTAKWWMYWPILYDLFRKRLSPDGESRSISNTL